jgi:hypothetical protein
MAHFHLSQQFALIDVSLYYTPITCEGILPILLRLFLPKIRSSLQRRGTMRWLVTRCSESSL